MLQNITLLGILGVLSYEDMKRREITVGIVLFGAAIGMLYHLLFWEVTWQSILLGLLPGALAVLLSWATRESIGLGDALIVCVAGLFLGAQDVCILLVSSVCMCGLFGLLVLTAFHKSRKWEIPFVPFLFCAYLGMVVLQW